MNEPFSAVVPAPDAAEEIEALILAGDLDAAVARLTRVPAESRSDPAIARLRVALHIAGRRSVGCDLEADARLLLPRPGQPPPDLVPLMMGLGPEAPIAMAAEAERRITGAAIRNAARELASGDVEVARDMLRQSLAAMVPSAQGFVLLGRLFNRERRPSDAAFAFQRAVDFDPGNRASQIDLGRSMLQLGCNDEAAEAYRQGIEDPRQQRAAYSCQLMAMVESALHDDAALRAAHRIYSWAVPGDAPAGPTRPPNDPLRVGFLWTAGHGAGAMLLDELMRHRTRDRWRALLYVHRASVRFQNSSIATGVDAWTVAHTLDDRALAAKIAADGVDVLIDLVGHGPDGRLGVFDFRPALVHASWIAYPWAIGHPAIDALIADPGHCPAGAETRMDTPIVRTALLSLTTTAIADGFAAIPAPAAGKRPITFGCFSPPGRIQPLAMEAWATIMAKVPNARLRMVHRDWGMGMARNRLRYTFMRREVDEKRIDFENPAENDAVLAHWRQIDVALDSVPTGYLPASLQSIVAGVPMVTLEGDRIAGRHTSSLLHVLGLDSLIARDIDSYARIAIRLATEPPIRERMRALIAERLPRSALSNGPQFAQSFEAMIEGLVTETLARRGSAA